MGRRPGLVSESGGECVIMVEKGVLELSLQQKAPTLQRYLSTGGKSSYLGSIVGIASRHLRFSDWVIE